MTGLISAQETWDLEKCVIYAVEHSIAVNQTDISIADREMAKKMSEHNRLPSLSGNVSAFTNFGRTIDPTTNDFITSAFLSNNFSVNAGVMLFNGGRLKNSIRLDELDKQAFMADKNSMIASVTLQVVAAYFEALFARDNYTNAEIQLKTINDQIDQMQKLVAAGSRAQFEIYDLEAQQASSEQSLTLAQNRIDLAMLNLKGIMNLSPTEEIELSNPPINQLAYTDIENATFEEIYGRVITARPELQAYDLRIKASEINVDIEKSSGIPSLSMRGSVSSSYSNQRKEPTGFTNIIDESQVFINGEPAIFGVEREIATGIEKVQYLNQLDNNFSYGFGLQLSVPILDNYQTKGRTEQARLSLESLRMDRDQYILDLTNTLGLYITDARAAKKNLDASEKVLTARQIAYDNAEKRFNLGAINSFDYISIQDQLNTARTDQIIAKYDYMMKIKILDYYQGYPVSLR